MALACLVSSEAFRAADTVSRYSNSLTAGYQPSPIANYQKRHTWKVSLPADNDFEGSLALSVPLTRQNCRDLSHSFREPDVEASPRHGYFVSSDGRDDTERKIQHNC